MDKRVELADTWMNLVVLFGFARHYTAALKAYGEIYKGDSSGNDFIDISQESLMRQLLSELSKIYDRESSCGRDNCSIKQLRKMISMIEEIGSKDRVELLRQIDELQKSYECLLPSDVRNKKIAHYDLKSIQIQFGPSYVLFKDIEKLVEGTDSLFAKIGNTIFAGELFSPYYYLVKKYKESLLEIRRQ